MTPQHTPRTPSERSSRLDPHSLDPHSLERRRQFLQIDPADEDLLQDLGRRIQAAGPELNASLADDFYDHLLAFDETRSLLSDPAVLARLHATLQRYFSRLLTGPHDQAYAAERVRVGTVHHRIQLAPQWYLSAFASYLSWVLPRLTGLYSDAPDRAIEAASALVRMVFFDLGLTLDSYLSADRHALTAAHRAARQVIDTMPVGILVIDQQLRIQLSNNVFHDPCGLDVSEFTGRQLTDLLDVPGLSKQAHQALATQQALDTGRHVVTPPSCLARPVRITLTPIKGLLAQDPSAGSRLLVLVEDLSEQERADTAERRFHDVVASASDGVVMSDGSGMITYVNRAAAGIFGYPSSDIVGQSLDMLMPPRARGTSLQARQPSAEDATKEDTAQDDANPLRHIVGQRKDGSILSLECTTSACRVGDSLVHTAILRDATRRQQAQVALRRSEKSFRELIEQSPEAIAVHRDGSFVYVNPAMVKLLGHASHLDLVGHPVAMIVHPDDRAQVSARIRATMQLGLPAPPAEVRFLCQDESVVHVEVIGLALSYQGQPAMVAIGRDLTQRQTLAKRMMEMDRMIAVGTLAAGVGHEINNPLTYVTANLSIASEIVAELGSFSNGIAQQLSDRFGPTIAAEIMEASAAAGLTSKLSTLGQALDDASDGGRRVRDIVRDLRSFSRPDDPRQHHKAVPLRAAIGAAVDMAYTEIRHRARLVKDYGDVPPVMGSAGRLTQVFLNLLVNAAHAIPAGDVDRNQIMIRTSRQADQVLIEVSDTGGGIPPSAMANLFEPFFTTKDAEQGTGLGLAICRQILSEHGGSISVQSKLGQGTCFRVQLPAAPPDSATVQGTIKSTDNSTEADPTPPPKARGARLLVIDDEPLVARLFGRILGATHTVVTVHSAAAAQTHLQTDTNFDLIFCDLMMPNMTGMDLYRSLQQTSPDLADKMVFMTGGAFTSSAREFLEQVDRPKLDKPFDPGELRQRVADLLGSACQVPGTSR